MLFGVDGIYTDNSIDVNYGGVSASTGYDDWNFAPNVNISHSWKANSVSFQFGSSAKHPAASKSVPVVNISNPLNITVGNTHLQPYIAHDFSLMLRSVNMRTFANFMATVAGTLYDNALTSASWFDQSGARYSVPVNSQDNSLQMISMGNYSLPLVAAPTYATPKGWEYNLSLKYTHGYGYTDGFNTETCTIDAKVTKTFGAFSVNAGLYDILNSKNSIQRAISDNYYEDQTRLHLGRHFLIGLRWNFGKMNPANSNRAQGDMQRMVR